MGPDVLEQTLHSPSELRDLMWNRGPQDMVPHERTWMGKAELRAVLSTTQRRDVPPVAHLPSRPSTRSGVSSPVRRTRNRALSNESPTGSLFAEAAASGEEEFLRLSLARVRSQLDKQSDLIRRQDDRGVLMKEVILNAMRVEELEDQLMFTTLQNEQLHATIVAKPTHFCSAAAAALTELREIAEDLAVQVAALIDQQSQSMDTAVRAAASVLAEVEEVEGVTEVVEVEEEEAAAGEERSDIVRRPGSHAGSFGESSSSSNRRRISGHSQHSSSFSSSSSSSTTVAAAAAAAAPTSTAARLIFPPLAAEWATSLQEQLQEVKDAVAGKLGQMKSLRFKMHRNHKHHLRASDAEWK